MTYKLSKSINVCFGFFFIISFFQKAFHIFLCIWEKRFLFLRRKQWLCIYCIEFDMNNFLAWIYFTKNSKQVERDEYSRYVCSLNNIIPTRKIAQEKRCRCLL